MELALQSLLKLPEHLMEGLLARRKVIKLAREKAVTLAHLSVLLHDVVASGAKVLQLELEPVNLLVPRFLCGTRLGIKIQMFRTIVERLPPNQNPRLCEHLLEVTLADFKRGTLKVKRLEFLRARAARGLQLIGLPLLFARKTFRLRNARTHGIGFRAQSFLSSEHGAERALHDLLLARKSRECACLAALYAPCKLPDKNSYLFPNSGKRRLDGCKIAFLFTARDERLNVLYERTDVRERYRCGVCLCSLALAPHLYHALNSPKFAGKFCALIPRLSKLSAQACESPFVVALCRTSP